MGFFKRGGKGRKGEGDGTGASGGEDDSASEANASAGSDAAEGRESSPQRVGVVSGVLSTPATGGANDDTLFGDVVARRFGPAATRDDGETVIEDEAASTRALPPRRADAREASAPNGPDERDTTTGRDGLRVVEPLFPDQPSLDDEPALEVDSMAHIGRATTITGNIVSEEDLEIQGTVEGSVRLSNHQVTIGAEGHVKASVDAEVVMVYGKVTGDIVASDLVEIEKGGIVGGDVKAPRIVMHDGAIVVGRLDMSAALPNGGGQYEPSAEHDADAEGDSDRPRLAPVVAKVEADAFDVSDPSDESDA